MTISDIDICKRLKALEYDGESRFLLVENPQGDNEYVTRSDYEENRGGYTLVASAPLVEEIAEWLREKHGLHISVKYRNAMYRTYRPWLYNIQIMGKYTMYTGHDYYNTYECALKNAVSHALELIEKKKI